jgi:tellurite resistance protein TerC
MQQGNTHPRPIESRPRRSRDLLVALSSVALGLGFSVAVWLARGAEPAQQYLSGYLIELSLSVDNVFVFALVFRHFAVGPERQRRLLFWGILGAVVLRSAFIAAGIGAITRFAWLVPLFGAFILATGTRLALSRSSPRAENPSDRPLLRLVARHAPPALAALVALETADLLFALDSLPAVIAVTHDFWIAMTSNILAVLGLRSLFTVVSGALQRLRYLKPGLAAVLAFVGLKMVVEPWYRVPTSASLAVIAAILVACAGASLRASPGPFDEATRSR